MSKIQELMKEFDERFQMDGLSEKEQLKNKVTMLLELEALEKTHVMSLNDYSESEELDSYIYRGSASYKLYKHKTTKLYAAIKLETMNKTLGEYVVYTIPNISKRELDKLKKLYFVKKEMEHASFLETRMYIGLVFAPLAGAVAISQIPGSAMVIIPIVLVGMGLLGLILRRMRVSRKKSYIEKVRFIENEYNNN